MSDSRITGGPEVFRSATPQGTDGWLAAAMGCLGLAIYVRTLAPGLLPGDSGELQTLAYLLGDTHPTGYPVYLLLGKVFTWLPVGDIAYRVNLLSAVLGAAAVSGMYVAGYMLAGRRWPAVLGALALAIAPTFWSQAVIAEVYTAGAAFTVAILLCLLLWDVYRRPRALFIAGLLGGSSLGVHLSVAFLAPAVGTFLLLSWRRGRAVWRSALLGALVGVGLMLAAFLAIDWHNPPSAYFSAVIWPARSAWRLTIPDLDSPFERLAFGLSGRQFYGQMFTLPVRAVLRQACDYWHGLPGELSLLVVALAGVGMLSLLVRRYRVAVLFLLALVVHWIYTFNYAIWDLYVFYIPGYVLLTLLAAAGAGWLVDGFHRLVQRRRLRIVFEPLLAVAVLAGGLWPAFAPRLGLVADGHLAFDYESFRADDADVADLHDFVSATVRSLPPSAIVFTDWDRLYPLYYAAHIEQGRTDLVFHETIPQMENNRLADSSIAYVRANLPDHPVFFSERRPEITAAGYRLVPVRVGPAQLYRVQPGG